MNNDLLQWNVEYTLKKMFNKQKKDNMDYESTLKDNEIKSFNKNISLLIISDTHGDLAY